MEEILQKYQHDAVSVNKLDGIRVDFEPWWFSLRASNTEPLLRLNVEASTKAMMEQKRDEIIKIIQT